LRDYIHTCLLVCSLTVIYPSRDWHSRIQ